MSELFVVCCYFLSVCVQPFPFLNGFFLAEQMFLILIVQFNSFIYAYLKFMKILYIIFEKHHCSITHLDL